MSSISTKQNLWIQMVQGKPALMRYFAYLGAILGVAFMAMFSPAYQEDSFFLKLIGAEGASWVGTGAAIGLLSAFAASFLVPHWSDAKFIRLTLPWLDGLATMILLAFFLAVFEPLRSEISYEDQSNLVSGRLIMAMNIAFLLAALFYITHLFAPESFIGRMATGVSWVGVYAGGSALLLRWYESYLIDVEIGHAPVSNLYEVFILLFCLTTVIYLAIERRYRVKAMGAFVMTLVAAGVFFGIWLDSVGQADIKPLVPALQSYWMKIHVPMNFIGYGAFAVAGAAGAMYLFRSRLEAKKGGSKLLEHLPTLEQLDEISYKSVAVGFPAFTLATILGAAWAAEAWGGYWSWDPKETWALIVWLVYGAYLHVRITHGWRGRALAWWTVAGFLVTLFCFLGVNLYLSGLHSYGRLA